MSLSQRRPRVSPRSSPLRTSRPLVVPHEPIVGNMLQSSTSSSSLHSTRVGHHYHVAAGSPILAPRASLPVPMTSGAIVLPAQPPVMYMPVVNGALQQSFSHYTV